MVFSKGGSKIIRLLKVPCLSALGPPNPKIVTLRFWGGLGWSVLRCVGLRRISPSGSALLAEVPIQRRPAHTQVLGDGFGSVAVRFHPLRRGSADPTRTPTGCYASTSRRAPNPSVHSAEYLAEVAAELNNRPPENAATSTVLPKSSTGYSHNHHKSLLQANLESKFANRVTECRFAVIT